MARWFPGRKLSLTRLGILILVVASLTGAAFYGWTHEQDVKAAAERTPWFDAYVDVTATPTFPFESPREDGRKNVVLSFIVADPANTCSPSWGGYYSLDEAEYSLDLDRRLQRLRNLGGTAMVSFGGQANYDIAYGCTDIQLLVEGYSSVVERYGLGSIDIDIEGAFLRDSGGIARQAAAIRQVQNAREGGLDVWLTLPVSPDGLTSDGVQAVRTYLEANVDLAGINAMTMNYGSDSKTPLRQLVERSLQATQAQLRSLYAEVNAPMGDATAWSKVSATPMIGQNDTRNERFTLADAQALSEFADRKGLGRISMWSANRDQQCADNWPDPKQVSDSCSGVEQERGDFSRILSKHRPGEISQIAEAVDTARADLSQKDDPDTSPYPIWNEKAAYPAETKIVWKRNVYEAKWWTEGDQPDLANDSGSQPWHLIGPVLPGEKPQQRLRLPEATYPSWSKDIEYRRGDRVMFDGEGYEAKWFSVGDSPDESLVQPQESPWRALTEAEIEALVSQQAPVSADPEN